MADSKLVSYEKLSRLYSPSQYKKTKITPHHAAGVFKTAKNGVDYFYNITRLASATYVVANDGTIGQCVREDCRAYTSSSTWNDARAVTIEVSNSKNEEPWPISDAAYEALVKLSVDICNRNGITEVNYTGDRTGVITEHRMFAKTVCPGETLHNLIASGKYCQDVNAGIKRNLVNTSKGYFLDGLDYSPVFNPTYYSSRYPDLTAAGLTKPELLFDHYIRRGAVYEWRKASDEFDPVVYRQVNADLQEAFDDDCFAYIQHYLIFGKKEIAAGKRPSRCA